nr:unnamed protein product [Digitaria exilis]
MTQSMSSRGGGGSGRGYGIHHHQHHSALCCLSAAPPMPGDATPTMPLTPDPAAAAAAASGAAVAVEGVLQKWTNYGRGWRERWFTLRDGVLYYSKIRDDAGAAAAVEDGEVRLIGSRIGGSRRREKPAGVVSLKVRAQPLPFSCDPASRILAFIPSFSLSVQCHDKSFNPVHFVVSAFRESKSDDRRFYIFSPTKTLHLKTDSKDDRVAWIEALILARSVYSLGSLSGRVTFVQCDVSISTARLRDRMHQEGLNENLIQDCEQIVLSEFSSYRKQLKRRYEDYLSLFGSCRHHFEEGKDGSITQGTLTRNEFSSSRHGNFSEYSTTESDEFEKQDGGELTCEEDSTFFDSVDYFIEPDNKSLTMLSGQEVVDNQTQDSSNNLPQIKRRTRLPEPTEKEKGISLWSIIKDSVGKDLTRVCLPVYFNEPLSSLQKCFEDLEYSYLLDQAYQYGKMVSHHPMLIACHCEGKGWKFWGDSNLKSKFWGQSIQVEPVGILTVEFDDGEIFQWNKVTTTIHNLILGKLYCSHHGLMHIKGNRQYSCKLKFKEPSLLDRNPHLEKLPPTDSRLRPDQRHLENGEYEKANAEKLRLERRQRMSTKLQDNGWKPQWFEQDTKDGTYRYKGGYWETREKGRWDGCLDIFGEFNET